MKQMSISITMLALAALACQTVLNSVQSTPLPQISELNATPTFPAENSGGESVGGGDRVPQDSGLTRAVPYPPRTLVTAGSLEVEVLNYERGEAAWQTLRGVNQFNQNPPTGMEYVLVRIYVKNISAGGEANEISAGDFRLTGDSALRLFTVAVVPPEPILKASLLPGEHVTGWAAYLVPGGETNLIVIVDQVEIGTIDGEYYVYIALEPGSAILPDERHTDATPTETGTQPEAPARAGETVTTNNWEVTTGEIIRGDQAWQLILAENQFNHPAPEGQEYLLVWVSARYFGIGDDVGNIDSLDFYTVDADGDVYKYISVVDPEPALDVSLFPGGQSAGWVTVLADVDAQNLLLVFEPPVEDTLRYFSLGE